MLIRSSARNPVPQSAAADLVSRAKRGDQSAVAAIYNRYIDEVYAFLTTRTRDQHLAEDLAVETFVRAMAGLSSFTQRDVDIGAWLLRIARNLALDHVKAAATRHEVPAELVEPSPDPMTPEDITIERFRHERLVDAVIDLPAPQREVIVMRFWRGMSTSEVAEELGRSIGAVKALQFRGCKALETRLRGEGWGTSAPTPVVELTK